MIHIEADDTIATAPHRRTRRLQSPGVKLPRRLPTVLHSFNDPSPRSTESPRQLAEIGIAGLSLTQEKNGSKSKRRADTVRVVVRCRPLNATERARRDQSPFRFSSSDSTTLQVVSVTKGGNNNRSGSARELVRSFGFDLCASGERSQTEFFNECGLIPLLDSVAEGYLATVFAYGQTGSGKTYSMSGLEEQVADTESRAERVQKANNSINPSDGLIPRAIEYLFSLINRAGTGVEIIVRASYCEIYNEQVLDLLNPESGVLNVRWNARAGFYVQDLVVIRCDSLSDALAVVDEGHRNRHVASRSMNADSSRSHSLLTIHVDRIEKCDYNTGENEIVSRFGKMCFVDLAGSERLKETKLSNAEETSNINRSLLTLGKVISALAALSAGTIAANSSLYIPYRDSKLTKLLMDSLGGQSMTLMIACISPSVVALEDTLTTLKFATRAKNIRNKPAIQVDPIEERLNALRHENQLLREENHALRLRLQLEGPPPSLCVDRIQHQPSLKSTLPAPLNLHSATGKIRLALPLESPSQRSQLQVLQDDYIKLKSWATAAEKRLNELQNDKIASRDEEMQNRSKCHGNNSPGSEIKYLRQQVEQLQQREQELMLALVRSSCIFIHFVFTQLHTYLSSLVEVVNGAMCTNMAKASSDVSIVRKGLPWLKRLQGSLEDDDSSDSSPQPTPKRVGKKQKKTEGNGARCFHKETRLDDNESDNALLEQSCIENKSGIEKVMKPRGKWFAEKSQSRQDLRKLKASEVATQREQLAPNRCVLSLSTGEQMTQNSKDNERSPVRAVQAARRVFSGKEAGDEDQTEPRRPPRFRLEGAKNHLFQAVKTRLRTDEVKQTDLSALLVKEISVLGNDNAADRRKVKSRTILSSRQATNEVDHKSETVTSTVNDADKACSTSAANKGTSSRHVKPTDVTKEGFAAMGEEFSEPEVIIANLKYNSAGCGKSEITPQHKSEDANEIKTDELFIAPYKIDEHQIETEASVEPEVVAEQEKASVKEEKLKRSPIIKASLVTMGSQKKSVTDALLDDSMPIPKKEGDLGVPSSTASFVIPKRRIGKADTSVLVERSDKPMTLTTDDGKRLMEPFVVVADLSLASYKSNLDAKIEKYKYSHQRRTKNSVPVKKTAFSTQDRALMRLSRKRNSILIASAELAAQECDVTGTKLGLLTQMMGYEVFDVDGSTLPDLIPRICCATNREMTSEQKSYSSSFFGVSRMAPKAASSCEFANCGTRKTNCYEELCFERLEDREFYQRKMYGSVFVPQNLRGWMTLIVRNAHFERKSTGIRFNQERDRESFAAALSKRYTLNKSVPRCDITRDNWQKLMKDKLGTVFLHYYNREDAEQASRVFFDDLGQPLQIRWGLKAGARIQVSSSPFSERKSQRTPPRSTSSEHNTIESSPLSLQNGTTRDYLPRPQSLISSARSDHHYSQHIHCQQLVSSDRDLRRFGSSSGEPKPSRGSLERSCQSRTTNRQHHKQNFETFAHRKRGESVSRNRHIPVTSFCTMTDRGNDNTAVAAFCDTNSPAQKRLRFSPHRSSNAGQARRKFEGGEEGECEDKAFYRVKGNVKYESTDRVLSLDERDYNCDIQRARSPSRRWMKVPHSGRLRDGQDYYSDNVRHSKRSTLAQHFDGQQQYSRDSSNATFRSRSRPRTSLSGYNGDYEDRYFGDSRKNFRRADSATHHRDRRLNEDVNSRAI
ncbi:putative kinesin-like protein [Plasmopara halstedii]